MHVGRIRKPRSSLHIVVREIPQVPGEKRLGKRGKWRPVQAVSSGGLKIKVPEAVSAAAVPPPVAPVSSPVSS
jgi:hypothetical protein